MQRLLYHAPDNPNQESPFDRAIVQVVQGQEVVDKIRAVLVDDKTPIFQNVPVTPRHPLSCVVPVTADAGDAGRSMTNVASNSVSVRHAPRTARGEVRIWEFLVLKLCTTSPQRANVWLGQRHHIPMYQRL